MLATLTDVLVPARKGKYGIGLFNTINSEMCRGVLAAAEEMNCPVIIGTAQVLFPVSPLQEVFEMIIPQAKRASVPVVCHLDHGLDAKTCRKALELGFTSIMYDCSTLSFEDNIKEVKELAYAAHSVGATIEGELGHVGDNQGSAEKSLDPKSYYTDPKQAREFVESTKIDALAIAVGTAHGAYKLPPKLDFERIKEIAAIIDTPLVLHGGSGLTDQDFRHAIECGISKVNIFTDINFAYAQGIRKALTENSGISDVIPIAVESVKQATIKKMKLFLGK